MPAIGRRKWTVFGTLAAIYFFLNLATFNSLGVVLYRMAADLHWSMTEAGMGFSVLGLACGLSSPLPALAARRLGGRVTVVLGLVLLSAGCILAAQADGLGRYYAATLLLGVGFSLSGNIPGVELIARWFSGVSSRFIGYYMMLGAFGGVFGPPIVAAIAGSSFGWRGHWMLMAAMAALLAIAGLAMIRDAAAPAGPKGAAGESPWTPRAAVFTPQFVLVAAAMTATMAGLTTITSVAVNHLVRLGASPSEAAFDLGAVALSATLVKGGAGRLCEMFAAHRILAAGLALQAVGCLLLAAADRAGLRHGGVIAFGCGFGMDFVAGTVALLEFFGPVVGARVLSMVWMLTTVAAAGPLIAGVIADRTGSFAPFFQACGCVLALLALPVFLMRRLSQQTDRYRGARAEAGEKREQ